MHAFKSVFLFSLEKYPEVGFLDCMVVLFLFSWGDFIPFSLAAAPICIPTGGAQGFPSPHILVNALYLLPAVLTGVRRYFARLWFTFPWGLVMLIIVSCFFFFLHTQVFLERLSTHILCPRWGRAVCPFDVEFVSSLYVLPTNPLSDRLFSHAVGWVFILCKIFLVWLGSIP